MQNEKQIKQSWEKTFDALPDLIALIDNKHRIVRMNKAMAARLNTNKNLCIGMNCYKCVHKLNQPPGFCPHVLTLKDGKEHVAEIYEKNLGGDFLISTTPLIDKNGAITGSVHVARDITKIKKSSEKLRQIAKKVSLEKAKYAALLSSIGHGVVATDKDGKIIFANQKFYQFLNKNHKKIIGKSLVNTLNLYNERGSLLKYANRPLYLSLMGKTVFSKDYCCIDKNKKKINMDIATAPIVSHGKIIGAIGVYEDITKEKEIERAKTEFVSLASHQLRTPITEISLSTEMLLSGIAGKVGKRQKKYLNNISYGVKEITGLIETLLNISRMQMGTFIISPKPVNLTILIDKLLDGFSMQIKKKRLILKKNYEKNFPKINLDPQIMQLILENLFSNAVKYTEKGIVGINIKKIKKNINIEVFDTGCGIPEQQKHLVFTKLFRSDNLLKNKTKGHGLGLYIVKVLVKNSGGKIWFESKEGRGTTFYVSFPLKGMKKKTQQSLI